MTTGHEYIHVLSAYLVALTSYPAPQIPTQRVAPCSVNYVIIRIPARNRFGAVTCVRYRLLTRDIDIAILSGCTFVRLSVRNTLVLYENGLTYRYSFFSPYAIR